MATANSSASNRKTTAFQRGGWSPRLRGTSGPAKGTMTTSPVSPVSRKSEIRRRLKVQTDLAAWKKSRTYNPTLHPASRPDSTRSMDHGRLGDVVLPRSILKSLKRSGYAGRLPLRSPGNAITTPSPASSSSVTWSPEDQVRLFRRGSIVSPYLASTASAVPAPSPSSSSARTPTTPQRLGNLFSTLSVGRQDPMTSANLGFAEVKSSVDDMLSAKSRRVLGEKVHHILTRDGLHALFSSMASYNNEGITRPFHRFEMRYLDGREWLNMTTRSKVISISHMLIDELGFTFAGEPDNESELKEDIRHAPDDEDELVRLILEKATDGYQHDKWRSLWTALMALAYKHGLEAVVRFGLRHCDSHVVSEMRKDPKALLRRGALHPASPQKSLAAVVADNLVSMSQRAAGVPPARLFELTTYIDLDTPIADNSTSTEPAVSLPVAPPTEVGAYCWVCMSFAGETEGQRRQHFNEHRSELAWARAKDHFEGCSTQTAVDEDEFDMVEWWNELLPLTSQDDVLQDADFSDDNVLLDFLDGGDFTDGHESDKDMGLLDNMDLLKDMGLLEDADFQDQAAEDESIVVADTKGKASKKGKGKGKAKKAKTKTGKKAPKSKKA